MEKKLLVLKKYGRDYEVVCIESYRNTKYQSLRKFYKFIVTPGQAKKIADGHSEAYICGVSLEKLVPVGKMKCRYVVDLMRADLEGCLRYKNLVAYA